MFMKSRTQSHPLLRCLSIVVVFGLSGQTLATDDFFLEGLEFYGLEENDFRKMQILPTRQLEGDNLFLAAAAERDSSMSTSQRLINNRWLLDSPRSSYNGVAALRSYLKMQFVQHWKAKLTRKQNDDSDILYINTQEPSQFTDLSNYRLRVSGDKVDLRFKYSFN